MKKILLSCLCLVPLFTGCGFEIPEKVSVKTNAQYSFSFGTFSKSISEYISVDSINDMINKKDDDDSSNPGDGTETSPSYNLKVYDYNPGGTSGIQQFLIEVPIKDIPVDVSAYMENLDFNSTFENMSFEKSISAPEFAGQKVEAAVQLPNIAGDLENLNLGTIPTISIENRTMDLDLPAVPITFDSNRFSYKSVKYEKGSLQFRFAVVPQSRINGFETTIKAIKLYEYDSVANKPVGEPLAMTSKSMKLLDGDDYLFEISLDGKTLKPLMCVKFEGSVKGVAAASRIGAQYSLSIGLKGTKLNSVEGFKSDALSGTEYNFFQTLKLDQASSDFIACKIKDGLLSVKAEYPAGWSGIEYESRYVNVWYGSKDRVDGEFIVDTSAKSDWTKTEENKYLLNRKCPLLGKIIQNGKNVTLGGAFNFKSGDDGINIVFEDGKMPSIKVMTEITISELDYAVVDFSSYKDSLAVKFEKDFPSEVTTFVNYMDIKPSGIVIEYENGLPAGNDINVKVVSELLGIDATESMDKKTGEMSFMGTESKRIKPSENSKIDMTADVLMPVVDDKHADWSILEPIVAGHDYPVMLKNIPINQTSNNEFSIKLNVKPKFDWEKISLNLGSAIPTDALEGNFDTGLSLSSLFDDVRKSIDEDNTFIKRLAVDRVPVYLYFSKPDCKNGIFNGITFSGIVKMSDGDDETYILGENAKYEKLKAVSDAEALEMDENDVVISKLSQDKASAYKDIASILNSALQSDDAQEDAKSLSLSYSLKMGNEEGNDEVEIEKSALEGQTATSIKVFARILLPLELRTIAGTDGKGPTLDIFKAAGLTEEGKDLFGRSEATDIEDFDKFTRIVDKVTMVYKFKNDFLNGDKSWFNFDLSKVSENANEESKPVTNLDHTSYKKYLSQGQIEITKNDLYHCLEAYPFKANFEIGVEPGTTIKVPRNAVFEAAFAVRIDTNGDEKIDLFGGEDDD